MFLSAARSPSSSRLEKSFFPEAYDCWLRRGKGFLNCSLWTWEKFFPHCMIRFGGRQDEKWKQEGCYQQGKVFDLKMEVLSKFTDRKNSLLFTPNWLIPRILRQPPECFWRAGNATDLTLISTLFCITDVSVEIKKKLVCGKNSRSGEIIRAVVLVSAPFHFFLIRCCLLSFRPQWLLLLCDFLITGCTAVLMGEAVSTMLDWIRCKFTQPVTVIHGKKK